MQRFSFSCRTSYSLLPRHKVGALRDAFGDELLSQLVLLNTKGYTGHAMGASFEDVAACEVSVCDECTRLFERSF